MDFYVLEKMRRTHAAWRLLAAGNAPLIIGFLHMVFIKPNQRLIPEPVLVSRLDDYLYNLHEELGETRFPKPARSYIDDWSSSQLAYLRRSYVADSDEPVVDITPATEKAIKWLSDLGKHRFVGASSRLTTVFDLLRQLAQGTDMDPQTRLAELKARRAEIDAQIGEVEAGKLALFEDSEVRERFYQITDMAQALLSDFREVEQNFRNLDRRVRMEIATHEGGKGDLLEKFFGDRDVIADSDQGKSFRAFDQFLMSPQRQREFAGLLDRVLALDAVRVLQPDPAFRNIHDDWQEAGDATQISLAQISTQLQHFLDDQAWLENRRIIELIAGIKNKAAGIVDQLPGGNFAELDGTAPELSLVMERPLFSRPKSRPIEDMIEDEQPEEIPVDALFSQIYVDRSKLCQRIRKALRSHSQISLRELLQSHPLEQGVAELVTYMSLASEDSAALIDDNARQIIEWIDARGRRRRAVMPLVVFARFAFVEDETGGASGELS